MPSEIMPNYQVHLTLETAKSQFSLVVFDPKTFNLDGPRADVEYRDLGLGKSTQGRIGAKHIRAIKPFDQETGWHWHDLMGHFIYVLKGHITFRYQGIEEDVTVYAGGCLSQPGGVPHNVVGRSDDLELLEISMPEKFGLQELNGQKASNQ